MLCAICSNLMFLVTSLVCVLIVGFRAKCPICHALACRLVVAAPESLFAFPEYALGFEPPCGGVELARERCERPPFALTEGKRLTAREAEAAGLADLAAEFKAAVEAALRAAVRGRKAVELRDGDPHVQPPKEGYRGMSSGARPHVPEGSSFPEGFPTPG